MSYSPRIVANWFLARGAMEGEYFTQMKLQKLVYIAHGWSLALTGKPLINEAVEAWKWGPVIRSLYGDFVKFGALPIDETPDLPDLQTKDAELLEEVWDVYKTFTAAQLSAMTHAAGTPWSQTFVADQKYTIPESRIREHYQKLKDR